MKKTKNELEKKLNEIRKEILILETLEIKPNFSELSRKYNLDRRTIKKYKDGYFKNKEIKNRKSVLEPIRDEIKEKLELPGATIVGVYQYFNKDKNICTYSNFYKYVQKYELKPKRKQKANLRFETDLGEQLQFDWKEDIQMISKYGELFEFNIFSATLGASRLHVFLYSKFKTRIDVQRCLIETFEYIGGVTKEILTDWINRYEDGFYNWVVEIKDTHEIIGSICEEGKSVKHKTISLGYCYGSKYWNKGYASEVLRRVIEYLLTEQDFYLVEANHRSSNPASGRVMEKAGMKYDGTLRERRINPDGTRADMIYYSITRNEL